ncbi:MAG: hypothetical protein PGN29_04935 [Gordonia paraffinivorans]
MRRHIALATAIAAVTATAALGAGPAAAAPGSVALTADLAGVKYSAPFECGLTVSNKGPGVARGARIIQVSVPLGIPTSFRYLGDLAPGESRTESQVDCGIYGRLSMYAVSLTPDLNPGNNGGQVFP